MPTFSKCTSMKMSADGLRVFVLASRAVTPGILSVATSGLDGVVGITYALGDSFSKMSPYITASSDYNVFVTANSTLGAFNVMSINMETRVANFVKSLRTS